MRACLLMGLVALAGCTQGGRDEAWSVELVEVEGHGPMRAPSEAWVRRSVHAAMGKSVLFSPGEAGLELRATYWELPDREGQGSRDLVVELELESPDLVRRADGPETLAATVLLERRGAGPEQFEGDLELALSRAMVVLDGRTRLAMGRPEQVAALLRSGDADMILLALEALREAPRRGAKGHASEVAQVLGHRDQRVRVAAVETLGAIGGPAQVRALIAQLRLSDPIDAEASYRALAAMGGGVAEDFLRFAAENEDEPGQRRAAALALRSMREGEPDDATRALLDRSHRR